MLRAGVRSRLTEMVGAGQILTQDEDLAVYAYDATLFERRPEVVVFPASTEQVAEILALANEERIAVVPRGAGTGLSGGAVPLRGGITLALSRMNHILEVDTQNLTAVVEPGVVNQHLQDEIAPLGLFYPPDPSSMKASTIGGNVAVNAGGPRCLKYGVTGGWVLGLEAVLPSGEVIHTGGRTVKNTTGYDLTKLLVGSEGTLAVITSIILRLMPLPEGKRTMLAIFDSLDAAASTVSAIISRGIVPATLEMMDNTLIRCAEDFTHAGLPTDAAAILLIEVDGFVETLDRQAETVRRVCQEEGAREVRTASTTQEADILWVARRTIIGAVARVRPSMILQDVTVPRSKLPAMVSKVLEVSRKYDMPIGVLAHAGDGNLHPLILFDQRNAEEMKRIGPVQADIFHEALALEGTLTGEHGIGLSKRAYLSLELKAKELEITRGIKQVFDPHNILNPGKIVE